jgi:DnaK suppressor protein
LQVFIAANWDKTPPKFRFTHLISFCAVPACFMAIRRAKPQGKGRRATTKDVVGAMANPKPLPAKWKRHHQHLMELRDDLLARKGSHVQDTTQEASSFSLHMADAATDSYDRDFALSRISSEQDALYEIEQALKRIHDGSFGVCEMTKRPIELERLEAIPWTRFSAAAEKELEKRGEIQKPRLGVRKSLASATSHEKSEEDEIESD